MIGCPDCEHRMFLEMRDLYRADVSEMYSAPETWVRRNANPKVFTREAQERFLKWLEKNP